jgi:hypothetical protein
MAERIHILVDREEKERFRRSAAREGRSLSEWLREAAKDRAAASESRVALDSREALEAFFAACDRRERGREPDWESHREVIERSIRSRSAP